MQSIRSVLPNSALTNYTAAFLLMLSSVCYAVEPGNLTDMDGALIPGSQDPFLGINEGRFGRWDNGIVPIAFSQDTAGPMARSVRDVAMALQVMAQPGLQENAKDPYVEDHPGAVDFLTDLDSQDLAKLRVGVWRAYAGADKATRVELILDEVAQALLNNADSEVGHE